MEDGSWPLNNRKYLVSHNKILYLFLNTFEYGYSGEWWNIWSSLELVTDLFRNFLNSPLQNWQIPGPRSASIASTTASHCSVTKWWLKITCERCIINAYDYEKENVILVTYCVFTVCPPTFNRLYIKRRIWLCSGHVNRNFRNRNFFRLIISLSCYSRPPYSVLVSLILNMILKWWPQQNSFNTVWIFIFVVRIAHIFPPTLNMKTKIP